MKKIKIQTLIFFSLGVVFLAFSIVESKTAYFYVSLANFAIFWFLYIGYLNEKIIRSQKDEAKKPARKGFNG